MHLLQQILCVYHLVISDKESSDLSSDQKP